MHLKGTVLRSRVPEPIHCAFVRVGKNVRDSPRVAKDFDLAVSRIGRVC